MIRLLVVGDGERDGVTIPRFVENVLKTSVDHAFHRWARLHTRGSGRGYARKVKYAVRRAQYEKRDGLVAVVDRDRSRRGERLNVMRRAREEDRQTLPRYPTALGEAIPHGEAWLLDDRAAVRAVLQLGTDVVIPTTKKTKNPKRKLEALVEQSSRDDDPSAIFAEIAEAIDPSRCVHSKETGFQAFVKDVRDEIGPLTDENKTG